jgi:hypothetical protein
MTTHSRLIGPAGDFLPDQDVVDVDVGDFVRRLLLFDQYIIDSARLREIPRLVSVFGSTGLITLLNSGALKIQSEAIAPTQIGQTTGFRRGPLLPLCSFHFSVLKSADHRADIDHGLKKVDSIAGISLKQTIKLKRTIVDSLVRSPENAGFDALKAARTDLENNGLLQRFVARSLREFSGVIALPGDISLVVRDLGNDDFKIKSDLTKFGVDEKASHQILERAVIAIASMNYRLEEMRNFEALSGILDEDVDLIGSKLDLLARSVAPQHQERRFSRVLEIAGLPDFPEGSRPFVDAEMLLRARESRECLEFREWLQKVDSISDAEIADRVASLNSKVAGFLQSAPGKTARFLVTAATGFAFSHPAAGLLASAIDSFLLDRIFRQSGPAALVNRLYPSIFR